MNIAFWSNQLCERGTETALYDYAYHNKHILGNKSYIFYEAKNRNNKQAIVKKFCDEFEVFPVEKFSDVDPILSEKKISHIFIEKSGQNDGKISKIAKNCIHCVFNCTQPHGEVYAALSPNLLGNEGKYPVVPYMIDLPLHNENMRNKLNIPTDSIVFGGYGGPYQFDIEYVHRAVYEHALRNPNVYFLFANFRQFCPPCSNIIHLPMITDVHEKVKFINTCDAMIWGRSEGETFGLSIAEFSTLNKPIIASKIGHNKGDFRHVELLGDKGIWYSSRDDLKKIFTEFVRNEDKDWNAYRDYTPEKVMKIFKEVYLDS